MTKKVPCESINWHMLPAIRRGLAIRLIQHHGCTQKEAAGLLGLTDAAVSQYLARKRGTVDFAELRTEELEKSALAILRGALSDKEICRLCKLLVASGALDRIQEESSF